MDSNIDKFIIGTKPATLELKNKWGEFAQQAFVEDTASGTLLRSCVLVASDGNALYLMTDSIAIGKLKTKGHAETIAKLVSILLGPSFRLNFIEPSGGWVSIPKRENKAG